MIKRFINNPCNIYFTFWCLYLLQGTLYASGSIISRALLVLILLISLWHFVGIFRNKEKPIYFKGLLLLLIMYIAYGVLLMITDGAHTQAAWEPSTFIYLKKYMISLLPIIVCYDYARRGFLKKSVLQSWVIVFLFVAIAEFFRIQRETLAELALLGSDREEITNNMGYILLSLVPCMFIFDNKPFLRYLGIIISTVFIIMAMKRGAILCCALALILIVWHELKNARGSRKLFVALVVVLAFLLLTRLISNMLATSEYFLYRIEQTMEGNSSYRDVIYSRLWDAYVEDANIFQMLFGRGADGTLKLYGNYAHQDWLETLTNQGLLGVILFFIYWLLFFRTSRNKSFCQQSRFVLFLIFCVFGLKTLFSMSIGSMTIYISSILGFSLADGFNENKYSTIIKYD